jgi:hypothetical protein
MPPRAASRLQAVYQKLVYRPEVVKHALHRMHHASFVGGSVPCTHLEEVDVPVNKSGRA